MDDFKISRRDLFKLGAIFYLGSSIQNLLGNFQGDRIIFTAEPEKNDFFDFNRQFFTCVVDLNNLKMEKIKNPLNCHSFVQNPVKKNQIIGIEKWGYGMGIFDSGDLRPKKVIYLEAPRQFVGHGDFASDGSLFYVSVSEYNDSYVNSVGKGLILVYETKSFSLVDQFETFGFEPHQISFFKDEKNLLILNPGFGKFFNPPFMNDKKGPINDFYPSITILERKTKTLIKKILFDDKEITMAHLTKLGEEDFFLVGGKKLPDNTWENKAFSFNFEKGLKAYETTGKGMPSIPLLSAAYSPNYNTLAATSPRSGTLLFWKDGILKPLSMPQTNGVSVTKDGKSFVVVQNKFISLVNASTGGIINQQKIVNIESSGGHSLII